MPKFRVKAMAVVEFDVDFPEGVTAAQARTRLVDEADWANRKSVSHVEDLIRVEIIEQIDAAPVMPRTVKK